ncbi:hypothetical protein [Proteus mirabilis]|uniref:hypothetical protein n=1 Tax=Proteus mirabilis TaxID=584 RepID=UPI000789F6BD|nr:hypothetical protein [Proteus mirabilis]QQT49115.1 hypothetical protein I6I36_16185 [Proteus mirabilis]HCT3367370.1 hypothetical protein [Proteus mirabilis]
MTKDIMEIVDGLKLYRKSSDDLSDELFHIMEGSVRLMEALVETLEKASFDNDSDISNIEKNLSVVENMQSLVTSALNKIDAYNTSLEKNYIPSVKKISNIKVER